MELLRGYATEKAIFGDLDETAVRQVLDDVVATVLGGRIEDVLFASTSVGVVVGVRLADGSEAVAKFHQPSRPKGFLRSVVAMQGALFAAGFPCPRPLAGPIRAVRGQATLEELVLAGNLGDAHDPTIRRAMAAELARLLRMTSSLPADEALGRGWSLWDDENVWPATAHSPLFDFARSMEGAEWIDEIAAAAKPIALGANPTIAAHTDWSAKHFRFEGDRVRVVYDWDSLALRTPAQAVGTAAATFTANPELDDGRYVAPTPDAAAAFVDDFQAAWPTPIGTDERRAIDAVIAYVVAYCARCEHDLGIRGSFTAALPAHAARLGL